MRYVGTPSIMVFVMSLLPFWKKFTAIAHTLSNDLEIIAPHLAGQTHMVKQNLLAPSLVEFLRLASGPVAAKEWAAQR
ncbi:MAG: hypothetical protein ABI039_06820 [Vicinamibacterales bacterium]